MATKNEDQLDEIVCKNWDLIEELMNRRKTLKDEVLIAIGEGYVQDYVKRHFQPSQDTSPDADATVYEPQDANKFGRAVRVLVKEDSSLFNFYTGDTWHNFASLEAKVPTKLAKDHFGVWIEVSFPGRNFTPIFGEGSAMKTIQEGVLKARVEAGAGWPRGDKGRESGHVAWSHFLKWADCMSEPTGNKTIREAVVASAVSHMENMEPVINALLGQVVDETAAVEQPASPGGEQVTAQVASA